MLNRTLYNNYHYNSLQEPIADPPTGLPESGPLPPLQRQPAGGIPDQKQEQVRKPQRGQEDFNQEQVETVREESVDADTDAEGEEEDSKDIRGGVHAAGASTATAEPDGDK